MSKCKVYYFKNSAENMIMGAVGKLEPNVDNYDYIKTLDVPMYDDAFMKMQRIKGEAMEVTNYNLEPVRSMCAGDIVIDIVMKAGYLCLPQGWKIFHPEEYGFEMGSLSGK